MKSVSILANWVLSALVIFLVAYYVPGVKVNSFITALTVAVVLGIFNAVIKPILVILTLPINILTLGLFTFVINALLIMLTAYFVEGFTVTGILPALVAAIALWFVNIVTSTIVFPIKVAR